MNETIASNERDGSYWKKSRSTLDALTGLRFVAAFCVLVHHAIGTNPDFKKLGLPFGNGAVTFFFVLSGFILTFAYTGRLNSWSDIRAFWFTRWARIWPLHVVCWMFAVGMLFDMSYLFSNFDPAAKSLCNLLLLQSWVPDYKWAFTLNGVSWSISDESFFYLIFPFLFLLNSRRFAIAFSIIIGVIVATVGLVQYGARAELLPSWFNPTTFVHLNPAIRSFDFLFGMLAGRIYMAREDFRHPWGFWKSSLAEFFAMGQLGLFWWYAVSPYRLWLIATSPYLGSVVKIWVCFSGLSISFAIAIYVFARSQGLLARLMGTRGMVYLGEISYSLYMCHALVIKHLLEKQMPQTLQQGSMGLILLLASAYSVVVSIFLYQLVELPAKSGLLALYRKDYRKCVTEVWRLSWQFWQSPLSWVTLGMAIAGGLLTIFAE